MLKTLDSLESMTITAAAPSLQQFVLHQTEVNRQLWYAVKAQLPGFNEVYNEAAKRNNERKLNEAADWLAASLQRQEAGKGVTPELFREVTGHKLQVLGMDVLGLSHEQLGVFEKEGILEISQQFFNEARRFDPKISSVDIFQASRNVWTATYLQILLGLEAHLTPSIFGYSMLYPVTDNFLDDPVRSQAEKIEFNEHFCAWLKGERLETVNAHEEAVRALIGKIEGQYARDLYPQVYESLLAIFCAQQESMLLPAAPVSPYAVDVLGVTLRKGGTSVLADGVLAAGELSPAQMAIIFDYGCFAQFMDDQEDVDADLRDRAVTVFSASAATGKLDDLMNRLFAYARVLLTGLDLFRNERTEPLIELSLKGIDLLMIDACLRTRSHYSRSYLNYLESFFPVHFRAMGGLQKKIDRNHLNIGRILPVLWMK
jgi:hypothetical protein